MVKKRVRKQYRKHQRGEPNCIICAPSLRGYRKKYRPSERRRIAT